MEKSLPGRAVPYRWIIAIVLFVAYSIQYLDRVKSNVLLPSIANDIGLTTADIGTGAFLMLLFYGPAQYVSGLLTDRFGAKRILIFSIVAWSVMTAWTTSSVRRLGIWQPTQSAETDSLEGLICFCPAPLGRKLAPARAIEPSDATKRCRRTCGRRRVHGFVRRRRCAVFTGGPIFFRIDTMQE